MNSQSHGQLSSATASAPGKLMLTGSYAVVHGRPCVVTAVDQRLRVQVERNGVNQFHLSAPDMGLELYTKTLSELGKKDVPKAVQFIETLYKDFLELYPQNHGINVITSSDFSSQVGFGSSSAVTVAFGRALMELYQIELTNHQLFEWCYRTVLKVQGVGSGFDLAAAIWGGTLKYVSPAKLVEPIEISADEMTGHLVVGYSGVKADTATLIRMVNTQLEHQPDSLNQLFDKIGETSDLLAAALATRDWDRAGQALSHHQALVAELGVSSSELDRLIAAAQAAGSFGASLSGAGGGDCMLAMTSPTSRPAIEAALAQTGQVIPVSLHAEGVRIEHRKS